MKQPKKSIPDESIFKDRKKEAQFWEEHFNEAWIMGKPVKAKFAKDLSDTITIHLDTKTLNVVKTQAKKKRVDPTQLIIIWIREKIGKRTNPSVGV